MIEKTTERQQASTQNDEATAGTAVGSTRRKPAIPASLNFDTPSSDIPVERPPRGADRHEPQAHPRNRADGFKHFFQAERWVSRGWTRSHARASALP